VGTSGAIHTALDASYFSYLFLNFFARFPQKRSLYFVSRETPANGTHPLDRILLALWNYQRTWTVSWAKICFIRYTSSCSHLGTIVEVKRQQHRGGWLTALVGCRIGGGSRQRAVKRRLAVPSYGWKGGRFWRQRLSFSASFSQVPIF
jgi:hypothetical protein